MTDDVQSGYGSDSQTKPRRSLPETIQLRACPEWAESKECRFGKDCKFLHGYLTITTSNKTLNLNIEQTTRLMRMIDQVTVTKGAVHAFPHTNTDRGSTISKPRRDSRDDRHRARGTGRHNRQQSRSGYRNENKNIVKLIEHICESRLRQTDISIEAMVREAMEKERDKEKEQQREKDDETDDRHPEPSSSATDDDIGQSAALTGLIEKVRVVALESSTAGPAASTATISPLPSKDKAKTK